jgi:lysozyme family protein
MNVLNDEEMIDAVLSDEAGLVENPADPGGITNFGITRRALAEFLGIGVSQVDPDQIRSLTPETARSFYRWFMTRYGIARIGNPDVRYFVFDAAVNLGPPQAIRLLQRALGVRADGILGPATLASIPYRDASKLCLWAGIEQMEFYGRLAAGDLTDADRDGIPDRLEFLPGWLNRLGKKLRGIM